MNLSVYGSTGFIGSNFLKRFPNNLRINRNSFEPKSNNVLYFISTVDNYNIFDDVTKDVKVNLELLCKILEKCKSEDMTFNFISSWFVYGKTPSLPATETSICMPKGFYSITKKCAEDLLISFCDTFDMKYRIIRLCNVMGLGDRSVSKKKNAITWMINQLKENKPIDLYDKGNSKRDILHVDDVCDAINLVCSYGKKNQIYNISSGKPIKINKIINLAYKTLDSNSKINYIKIPKFHSNIQINDFWMSNRKIKDLGFEQKISIENIVKELCY